MQPNLSRLRPHADCSLLVLAAALADGDAELFGDDGVSLPDLHGPVQHRRVVRAPAERGMPLQPALPHGGGVRLRGVRRVVRPALRVVLDKAPP